MKKFLKIISSMLSIALVATGLSASAVVKRAGYLSNKKGTVVYTVFHDTVKKEGWVVEGTDEDDPVVIKPYFAEKKRVGSRINEIITYVSYAPDGKKSFFKTEQHTGGLPSIYFRDDSITKWEGTCRLESKASPVGIYHYSPVPQPETEEDKELWAEISADLDIRDGYIRSKLVKIKDGGIIETDNSKYVANGKFPWFFLADLALTGRI